MGVDWVNGGRNIENKGTLFAKHSLLRLLTYSTFPAPFGGWEGPKLHGHSYFSQAGAR